MIIKYLNFVIKTMNLQQTLQVNYQNMQHWPGFENNPLDIVSFPRLLVHAYYSPRILFVCIAKELL